MTREEAVYIVRNIIVDYQWGEDQEAALDIAVHDILAGKFRCQNCHKYRMIFTCKDCPFDIKELEE